MRENPLNKNIILSIDYVQGKLMVETSAIAIIRTIQ
jgi:hypothetical protein